MERVPAVLAPSRQVPWALSPALCAPGWDPQHSPPPSTGLRAHGTLQPAKVPDGEQPGTDRTSSPSILPRGGVPRRLPAGLLDFSRHPLRSCRPVPGGEMQKWSYMLLSPAWGSRDPSRHRPPAPADPGAAGHDVQEPGLAPLPPLCRCSPGVGGRRASPRAVGAPVPDTHPGRTASPTASLCPPVSGCPRSAGRRWGKLRQAGGGDGGLGAAPGRAPPPGGGGWGWVG